jgi:hypothetical protein
MNKKEYIRPVSIMVKFGDDLMDLNGLSVHGKNPDGDNVSVGEGGEGSMEEEALSKSNFISIWEDDAFTGHVQDELFE